MKHSIVGVSVKILTIAEDMKSQTAFMIEAAALLTIWSRAKCYHHRVCTDRRQGAS